MKRKLLLAVLLVFSLGMSAQNCTELFISEYIEGSGNNKGVEIYNPTDGIINLGSYYVARYSNGANTYTDGGITQLEGFIQAYSTHLLVNGQTTSTETSPASDPNFRALAQQLDHDYPAPTYMNGNDAIALFKDNGGSGNVGDFVLVDLFGIIGGGMPSDGAGWASFTNEYVYKNIYEGEIVVGTDSIYISNFIVPAGYYWIPWSSNHSLVRKPSVKKGITASEMPAVEFDVTIQWDTVPGGVDMWDSLGTHYCDCQYGTRVDLDEVIKSFSISPNPAFGSVQISYVMGIDMVNIFDLTGKQVYRSESLAGITNKNVNIDFLNKGIYIVKIHSKDAVLTQKMLKY